MNELISIIVPIYNVEQYLHRCIDSILAQTYKNIEIILVDDGSTDSSGMICDEYQQKDNRVRVIHKKNEGVSAARNAALEIANGEYIGCVDSDDWIEPEMYETMLMACIENHVTIAFCNYSQVSAEKTINRCSQNITVYTREELLKFYISGDENVIINNSVWSKLFCKDLAKDILFAVGKESEDIMYTTKLLCKLDKGVYIDQCLYNYVVDREGSIMNSNRSRRVIDDEIPFWFEHISYIRNQVSDELGDYAAFYFYRRLISYYLDATKDKGLFEMQNQVREVLLKQKEQIKRIYPKYASKGDKVRMFFLFFSPTMLVWFDTCFQKMLALSN